MSIFFVKGWIVLVGLCLQLHSVESKKLMVLLLNGFRWDYFKIHGDGLRGFPEIFKTGMMAEHTEMDFPTESYPNQYTVMTGLYDEIHGMVANKIYDPLNKAYFKSGPTPSEGYDQPFWWDGGDPLWITATRQHKSAHMYYWPHCEVEIRGLKPAFCLPHSGIPSIKDFKYAMTEGIEALYNSSADLVGIYFQLSDSRAHRFGPRSPQVRQVIKNLDRQLYQMLRELEKRGIPGEVDIVIVSDHGMTDVSPNRVLGIEQFLDVTDVDAFLGGGPFLSIWSKPGKLDKVYTALKNASEYFSVYKKEETPLEWHYRKHYRIAPIVVSPALGWLVFKPKQVIPGGRANPQIGNHGYDGRHPDMWGIFVATGPSFKSSYVSKAIKSVDMYQVMCKSLGIQPSPHNGTWDNVKDMFRAPAEPAIPMLSIDSTTTAPMSSTQMPSIDFKTTVPTSSTKMPSIDFKTTTEKGSAGKMLKCSQLLTLIVVTVYHIGH